MDKRFYRLDANSALVQKLKASDWWMRLAGSLNCEKDVNVQVRGSYLNVYYKMNNLLKIELGRDGELLCSAHYKFLPLIKKSINPHHPSGKTRRGEKEQENCYVAMSLEKSCLNLPASEDSQYEYEVIDKDLLSPLNLKLLKEQMSKYATEEKEYQSKFIDKNKNTILDAELAFNERQQRNLLSEGEEKVKTERTRIDLLNYDKNLKQMVAIELKMVLDKRLYDGEIKKQLKKYSSFLKKKTPDLQLAYQNVRDVKGKLGLLAHGSLLPNIDFSKLEIAPKPLLVVVCYERDVIEALKGKIMEAVKDCALGVYFFRSVGDLNLVPRTRGYKIIF